MSCGAAVQQQQQQGSHRIRHTDPPVIVTTKQLMLGCQDVLSLAQGMQPSRSSWRCCTGTASIGTHVSCEGKIWIPAGVVHWSPPPEALSAAQEALQDPGVNSYGPADGYPPLVAALQHKIAQQNGLPQV